MDSKNISLDDIVAQWFTIDRQASITKHPVFTKLLRLQPDSPQAKPILRAFIDRRYNAAGGFLELLNTTIKAIEDKQEMRPIYEALHNNRADETGVRRQFKPTLGYGEHDTVEAHNTWRARFLEAMDINYDSSSGFLLYVQDDTLDFWQRVGMLLVAEKTIPYEDRVVLRVLEKIFPERFQDTTENFLNRQYLADHVQHDANSHYPELRQAVLETLAAMQEADKEDALVSIQTGAQRFVEERRRLYDYADDYLAQLTLRLESPVQQRAYAALKQQHEQKGEPDFLGMAAQFYMEKAARSA